MRSSSDYARKVASDNLTLHMYLGPNLSLTLVIIASKDYLLSTGKLIIVTLKWSHLTCMVSMQA